MAGPTPGVTPGSAGGRQRTPFYRPRDDRWIAGVCSGLARRFGMPTWLVRLLFVVSCLLPGPQFVIYIVLWIMIPSE